MKLELYENLNGDIKPTNWNISPLVLPKDYKYYTQ